MAAKRTAARRKPAAAKGALLRNRGLPRYDMDDGPLARQQMDAIERLQRTGRMKAAKRLF